MTASQLRMHRQGSWRTVCVRLGLPVKVFGETTRDLKLYEQAMQIEASKTHTNKTHRTPSTFLQCRIDWDRLYILILSQCSGQNLYHVRYRQSSLTDSIFYLSNMLACRCCLRAFARLSLSLASLLLAKVSACIWRVCRLYRHFQEYVFTLKCIGRIVQIRSAFSFQQINPLYTSTSLVIGDQSAEGLKHCDLQILRSWAIQKYTANQKSSNKTIKHTKIRIYQMQQMQPTLFPRFWATELLKWFIHTRWNYQTIPDTHPAASCLVQGFFILIQQVESWRSSGKDCTSSYQHKRHQYIATTLRLIATNFLHPDL